MNAAMYRSIAGRIAKKLAGPGFQAAAIFF
jgi:hypothetical protein